ncbi:hypothetical protein JOB18_032244 [Solea senegalensis]|uniref:Uncharacterized protein n=1 Tax=Solea senegalensis TaxID=28829 RepID=A0AAV6RCT6_SOLSE|nr:hypothetical protein JOB18_032244 [Solea senegalensis]
MLLLLCHFSISHQLENLSDPVATRMSTNDRTVGKRGANLLPLTGSSDGYKRQRSLVKGLSEKEFKVTEGERSECEIELHALLDIYGSMKFKEWDMEMGP